MKMRTPDGTEVMKLNTISRSGNNLSLNVVVMGAMPMTVVLSPTEARSILPLLNWRLILFLLTFLFRR